MLAEIFADPFDRSASLQLNNKHWPGEGFTLLSSLKEAELAIESQGIAASLKHLEPLRRYFADGQFYGKFLRRLHRIHLFKSQFGCEIGRIQIDEQAIEANRYRGSGSRASYDLQRRELFHELVKSNADIYKREYGADLIKTVSTVRYAEPDERQADVTDFGTLSDFHNDEYKGISTIVYLCDVGDDNGAFSFVRGSNLVPRSLVITAIHQCVEFDMKLTTPDQLKAVPLEFRGSLAIGNFLDPEKVRLVEQYCEVLKGATGTFVTFNGQYLLHRGGKPLAGTRTAAFFQPIGLLMHRMKSVGSVAFAARHR